jgi:excisionase family DNA binding protein
MRPGEFGDEQMQLDHDTTPVRGRPRRNQHKPVSVTIDDTCQMIGIGRTKVYELIAQGRLQTVCIGTRRVVLVASIEALIGG